jgi:signal recognition particle subunit SEC65
VTPNELFLNQRKQFWAYVRSISQKVGYTVRKTGQIRVPTVEEMAKALRAIGLDPTRLQDKDGNPTDLGKTLSAYFQYRADVLNTFVQPRLMNVERAKELFNQLQAGSKYKWPVPMNKQKGEKKAPAYLTAIINMLIETNAEEWSCDLDPRALTTVTFDGSPLRTLARRVDGAFPSAVNPIAVWEIKEYYYTTTFGSRVADGVYETLLDGMELEELRVDEGVSVLHYLMVDDHLTWWVKGRSYLCRIIDMLHMGYVDEVLVGSEVVERLPTIVKGWVELARKSKAAVS